MKLNLGTGLVALLAIIGTTLLTQNLGWSASITCDPNIFCKGTTGNDVIRDGNDGTVIAGLTGDDTINSGAGDDDVCAGGGNDKVNLGNGDDRAWGDGILCAPFGRPFGADTINGGPGNDFLNHGEEWSVKSDGFKDIIDCGPGNDIAQLNITIDHDEAINCEQINPFPDE
jgi:Ca2+-binding RTX toxin-like protein